VFVGDGPYRKEVEAGIRARGLESRIRFLGVLRGEALVEAINACEVFLITSMSETQSMTTLQAMACELPVVVVSAGGLPEYVKDGKTGFVLSPGRWGTFADKIIYLLKNPSIAQQFGQAGRASVEQFSPERITRQFEELYRASLQKRF
jgi:glycosyltransferase involved in cell wall biosynthesis